MSRDSPALAAISLTVTLILAARWLTRNVNGTDELGRPSFSSAASDPAASDPPNTTVTLRPHGGFLNARGSAELKSCRRPYEQELEIFRAECNEPSWPDIESVCWSGAAVGLRLRLRQQLAVGSAQSSGVLGKRGRCMGLGNLKAGAETGLSWPDGRSERRWPSASKAQLWGEGMFREV
jgi:hypothetical protein